MLSVHDIAQHSIVHMDACFLEERIEIESAAVDSELATVEVILRERSLPNQPREWSKQLHIRLNVALPDLLAGHDEGEGAGGGSAPRPAWRGSVISAPYHGKPVFAHDITLPQADTGKGR